MRLRYNRQAVSNAESFRAQIKQALQVAEQEARSGGCNAEDVKQAIFAVVAFLDESALGCRNPAFADWARLPLQAELYGHQLAGEVFFQELQKTLNRNDSPETADLLEVYYLCLLLGFKGRYAAGGDLRSIMAGIQEKIRRVRGPSRRCLRAEVFRPTPFAWYSRTLGSAGWRSPVSASACWHWRSSWSSKFVLISGASELSASATQFVK